MDKKGLYPVVKTSYADFGVRIEEVVSLSFDKDVAQKEADKLNAKRTKKEELVDHVLYVVGKKIKILEPS